MINGFLRFYELIGYLRVRGTPFLDHGDGVSGIISQKRRE